MQLRYDRAQDRYIGDQITIAERRFAAALRMLLKDDADPDTVLEFLLDESSWLDGETRHGTEAQPRCRACLRPLDRPQYRYCDAGCEAAMIVREHWR